MRPISMLPHIPVTAPTRSPQIRGQTPMVAQVTGIRAGAGPGLHQKADSDDSFAALPVPEWYRQDTSPLRGPCKVTAPFIPCLEYREQILSGEITIGGARPKRAGDGLAQGEIDLAAYMVKRANIKSPVDDEEGKILRDALDTVNRARGSLYHGRANMWSNLERSKEPFWRVCFGRNFSKKIAEQRDELPVGSLGSDAVPRHIAVAAIKAAVAMYMGAGRCGEYALVAMVLHAAKLKEGETLSHIRGIELDHCWLEWETSGMRVIIDPWAYGPPVRIEDCAFGDVEKKCDFSLNRDQAEKWVRLTTLYLGSLGSTTGQIRRTWVSYLGKNSSIDLNYQERCVGPTSVISEAFHSESAPRTLLRNISKLPFKFDLSGVNGIDMSKKIQLGREIKAMGVARALGANINQSLEVNGRILRATAGRLFSDPSSPSS